MHQRQSRGGADLLYGDAGNDTFIFGPGNGNDVIADFNDAGSSFQDMIDVSAYNFTDMSQFHSITQDGSNTVIDFNGTDTVTLLGVASVNIGADDFIFKA